MYSCIVVEPAVVGLAQAKTDQNQKNAKKGERKREKVNSRIMLEGEGLQREGGRMGLSKQDVIEAHCYGTGLVTFAGEHVAMIGCFDYESTHAHACTHVCSRNVLLINHCHVLCLQSVQTCRSLLLSFPPCCVPLDEKGRSCG